MKGRDLTIYFVATGLAIVHFLLKTKGTAMEVVTWLFTLMWVVSVLLLLWLKVTGGPSIERRDLVQYDANLEKDHLLIVFGAVALIAVTSTLIVNAYWASLHEKSVLWIPRPSRSIDRSNELHLAWRNQSNYLFWMYYNGSAWSPETQISNHTVRNISIGYQNDTGRMFVSYLNSSASGEIWFVERRDGEWHDPVQVYDPDDLYPAVEGQLGQLKSIEYLDLTDYNPEGLTDSTIPYQVLDWDDTYYDNGDPVYMGWLQGNVTEEEVANTSPSIDSYSISETEVPRGQIVSFVVTATDIDGDADIADVSLRIHDWSSGPYDSRDRWPILRSSSVNFVPTMKKMINRNTMSIIGVRFGDGCSSW